MKSIVEQLKEYIDEAEAIVIGAGAGLSSAAGFEYGGETFKKHFSDIHRKYGYTDMYSAGFHPYKTSEEKWGFWARNIYLNRYKDGVKPLYQKLREIFENKNYFVITTNVDHQFQLAGFRKARLFYTQGDYGLFQCSNPCYPKTYDNKEAICKMLAHLKDGRIPADLVPHCPICGAEMTTNLRIDDRFVEDDGWHAAQERYRDFLRENRDGRILFLELGVGFNTPGIIKYPFWKMTYRNPKAIYACINMGEAFAPREIAKQSVCVDGDIGAVLEKLK